MTLIAGVGHQLSDRQLRVRDSDLVARMNRHYAINDAWHVTVVTATARRFIAMFGVGDEGFFCLVLLVALRTWLIGSIFFLDLPADVAIVHRVACQAVDLVLGGALGEAL